MKPERLNVQHEFDNEPSYIMDADGDSENEVATVPAGNHEFAYELAERYNSQPKLKAAVERILRSIQWSYTGDRLTQDEQVKILKDALE